MCENTFETFYYHVVLTCGTVSLLNLIGTINLLSIEFIESPIKVFILNTVKGERILNHANKKAQQSCSDFIHHQDMNIFIHHFK